MLRKSKVKVTKSKGKDPHWFSFDAQRVHIFELARELKINDDSINRRAMCTHKLNDFVALVQRRNHSKTTIKGKRDEIKK